MAEVHGGSEALGWVCIAISTLFFGSNFVPVKRYETHDGMFFQWVMCAAIFLVGLFVQFTLFTFPELVPTDGHWEGGNQTTRHWVPNGTDSGRPNGAGVTFMPLATVGGVLWATGNTLSVPVINSIGFGLGQLIWNSANMLMGWASGKFGLFIGSQYADEITYPNLNYAGVALARGPRQRRAPLLVERVQARARVEQQRHHLRRPAERRVVEWCEVVGARRADAVARDVR